MTNKELQRKLDMVLVMLEDMAPRLKILEAAYTVQNKKLRELTRPPQSAKLTKSQEHIMAKTKKKGKGGKGC